jgi:hypothetical protein
VEDEYFIADDMRQACEAIGATVFGPVSTVGAALELIRETGRLDAAVLDVNLQGDMVYPVADALLARGVPFALVTGYDRAAIPARYAQNAQYERPVEPSQISKTLFAR